MFGVFLAFYDASGERHLKKLDINSFWLPSAAPKKDIKLQVDAQTGVLIGRLNCSGVFIIAYSRRDQTPHRNRNAHQLR